MLENIRCVGINHYLNGGCIVLILKVNDVYEYYVRDEKGDYAFEFMFGVTELTVSMCEVAIEQFKEAYENDSEVH